MQSQEKIVNCYNQVADNYAAERSDELSNKHLDRLLLKEFARVNKDKGLCADFGCGPGQATKFLYDHGLKNIIGVDLSSGMIETARRLGTVSVFIFDMFLFTLNSLQMGVFLFFVVPTSVAHR